MKKITLAQTLLFMFFITVNLNAQTTIIADQRGEKNIENALLHPEKVIRLDLSNQNIDKEKIDFSKFINLEYLSIENDYLKEFPKGISSLKKLKTLNLSGNDFEDLPKNFNNLVALEELFLNNDLNFKFERNLKTLSKLPSLNSLHLENDELNTIPSEIKLLKNLKKLYLSNNKFEKIPLEIEGLNNLKYLDLKNNLIKQQDRDDILELNFGFQIKL
jgi:Leucine-rich repeat (LRR) protein